ncbi:MAG: hypothetical protein IJG60_00150 [Thermoguttaceae bacterium]|nr:hypothetical protein [Thermoguttaceae bacterium]
MKRFITGFSLTALVLFAALVAKGDAPDAENAKTWDENATAESLGLEPLKLQDGFFPLFPWGGLGDTDTMIGSISECGFNMPGFISADALPTAQKYSMKAIIRFPAPLYAEGENVEEYEEKVKEAVAPTKDDPDVIGYCLTDEPGADKFPILAVTVAAIKKYAPGKLAYINLFPGYATTLGADAVSQLGTWTYTEYLERYVQEVKPQFISYDNYMVEYSEDMMNTERAASYWTDMLEVRRIAMKYKLPWWNIISCLAIQTQSSPPTAARYAFQAYTSLAAGCNALSWFIYTQVCDFTYSPLNDSGDRTLSWLYLQAINRQIQTVGSFLTQFESTDVWFSDPAPMPDLPQNPGTLVADLTLSWSKMAEPEKITDTPQVMVGEFRSKEDSRRAVMIVNLNFGRSLKVDFQALDGYRVTGAFNPVANKINERPETGWWILPGHGTLFILEK